MTVNVQNNSNISASAHIMVVVTLGRQVTEG